MRDDKILLRVSIFFAVKRRSSGTSALYCTLPLLSTQRNTSPDLFGDVVAVALRDALTLVVTVSVPVLVLLRESVGMKLENGLGSEADADGKTAVAVAVAVGVAGTPAEGVCDIAAPEKSSSMTRRQATKRKCVLSILRHQKIATDLRTESVNTI
jgi:hypothetical protein